jgi:hypothetical protein
MFCNVTIDVLTPRFNDRIHQARRHPEVLAIFGEPRRMPFRAVLAAILRGAQESARTSG